MNPKVRNLSDVKGFDGYLNTFGAVLGAKANQSLSPLHIPDTHPLPDFSHYKLKPYPAQAHLIAAGKKLFQKRVAAFIIGECGCIAGESEVYDPVARVYRRVDQITEPFHVVSYHGGQGRGR